MNSLFIFMNSLFIFMNSTFIFANRLFFYFFLCSQISMLLMMFCQRM